MPTIPEMISPTANRLGNPPLASPSPKQKMSGQQHMGNNFRTVSLRSMTSFKPKPERTFQEFIRNRRPLGDAELYESLSKGGEFQADKIIELHADDVICCVDTALLASESQYVKTMLYSFELLPVMTLGEKVNGDALLVIIDALHSGVIQFREGQLEAILQAASFLQMPSMLETLGHVLKDTLTVEDAVRFINLGEKYSLPSVRSAAEALLCKNVFSLDVGEAQSARHSTWFHHIPYERMLSLMELSNLQATNSTVRFLAAVTWVKAARMKRADRLDSLLETIALDKVEEGVIRREIEKIPDSQDPVRTQLDVCLEEYDLRRRCRSFKTVESLNKEPSVIGLNIPAVCQYWKTLSSGLPLFNR